MLEKLQMVHYYSKKVELRNVESRNDDFFVSSNYYYYEMFIIDLTVCFTDEKIFIFFRDTLEPGLRHTVYETLS